MWYKIVAWSGCALFLKRSPGIQNCTSGRHHLDTLLVYLLLLLGNNHPRDGFLVCIWPPVVTNLLSLTYHFVDSSELPPSPSFEKKNSLGREIEPSLSKLQEFENI